MTNTAPLDARATVELLRRDLDHLYVTDVHDLTDPQLRMLIALGDIQAAQLAQIALDKDA